MVGTAAKGVMTQRESELQLNFTTAAAFLSHVINLVTCESDLSMFAQGFGRTDSASFSVETNYSVSYLLRMKERVQQTLGKC